MANSKRITHAISVQELSVLVFAKMADGLMALLRLLQAIRRSGSAAIGRRIPGFRTAPAQTQSALGLRVTFVVKDSTGSRG
jgi:hypothetical protein